MIAASEVVVELRVDQVVEIPTWAGVTILAAMLGAALIVGIFIGRWTRRKGPPPLPRG